MLKFGVERLQLFDLKWNKAQLKRVLYLESKLQAKRDVRRGAWSYNNTEKKDNNGLSCLLETKLLEFPLNKTIHFGREKSTETGMRTVQSFVDNESKLLSAHVQSLKEAKKYSKPVHAFMIVQVSDPVIVTKI